VNCRYPHWYLPPPGEHTPVYADCVVLPDWEFKARVPVPVDPVVAEIKRCIEIAKANRSAPPGTWHQLTPDYWKGKINGLSRALQIVEAARRV